VVDQAFLSVATFATGAMLARATSKEQYSVYVLATSLVLILQGIPRALVNVPFTIYAPRLNAAERRTYQGSALTHTLCLSVAVALAMLGAYLLLRSDHVSGSPSLIIIFPSLALVAVATFMREFIRGALLAQLRIGAGVAVNMLATAGQLVLTAWLFGLKRLTIESALHIIAAASLVAATWMLWSRRAETQVVARCIWPDFRRGLKTGRWILVEALAYSGASQAYPWLLLYFTGARTVAVFGVCNAFAGLLGPFLRGASSYIHPRMVHGYVGTNAKNLLRLLRLSVLVVGVPYGVWAIVGGLFADELITLIYGSGYSGYAALTMLLLLRMLIEGVASPLSQALQTIERADIVTVSQVLAAVLTLGLGTILVWQMGLVGAGIAATVSAAVSALWKWRALRSLLLMRTEKSLA